MDLQNITGITLGIRHIRSFRVEDMTGEIVDHILHSEGSPFSVDYFPRIRHNAGKERVLHNDDDEYIRVNRDDFISYFKIENDFQKKFQWIQNTVIPYIEKLFSKYKIKKIKRLGVIFHHNFQKNDNLKDAVISITGENEIDPNSINISFSKRIPTKDGIIRGGVIDYKNVIYTFEQDAEQLYFNFDFQYYYDPIVEDLRSCSYSNLLVDAQTNLTSMHNNWLEKYGKTEE